MKIFVKSCKTNNHTLSSQSKVSFLGLTYSEGSWKWLDNTPLDFTNWADGQPGGIRSGEVEEILKTISGETNFTCAGINNKGQWLPKVSFFDFDTLMKLTSVW